MTNNLTKDEIRIILTIDKSKVEYWAQRKEFWKIYKHIIRKTSKQQKMSEQQ